MASSSLRVLAPSPAAARLGAVRLPGAQRSGLPAPLFRGSRLVRASQGQDSDSSNSNSDKIPSPITNEGYGLGRNGAFFGFGPRQELNVGRLAMMGFASGVIMEVLTGKGILAQLGIDPISIRFPFLAGFGFLLIGGLLGGYVVINNPPDVSKAPANEGEGLPRNPLATFDPKNLDPLTTYTRGGVVTRRDGQKGREPYVSDLPKKE